MLRARRGAFFSLKEGGLEGTVYGGKGEGVDILCIQHLVYLFTIPPLRHGNEAI